MRVPHENGEVRKMREQLMRYLEENMLDRGSSQYKGPEVTEKLL